MSGFEVAGIVLGSIPILVSALQIHAKVVKSGALYRWRFYTRELKSLTRDLEVEHVRLMTVFEKLLSDIVPDEQIDAMINNPFGPLWKDRHAAERIRKRLGRSMDSFEKVVQDMQETMEEIGKMLGLGPDGDIAWMRCSGIRKELKRAQFILQRSDYDDLIKHLRSGVSKLEELLQMGVELESKRYRRSQRELYRAIQDHSSSIHNALKSALSCRCAASHKTGFKLMRPYSTDTASTMAKGLMFHIALSTPRPGCEDEGISRRVPERWDLLKLSINHIPDDAGVLVENPRTRLRFFLPPATLPAAMEDADSTVNGNTLQSSGSVQKKTLPTRDLCGFLQEPQAQEAERCYGCITDKLSLSPRAYQVHSLGTAKYGKDWTLTSLRSILAEDPDDGRPTQKLRYGDGLQLAWMVASSVVQLRDTSWLPSMLTHNDIFLVRQEEGVRFRDVFLINSFRDPSVVASNSEVRTSTATAHKNSPSPAALGILLIELILGKTIDQLRPSQDGTKTKENHIASLVSDYQTLIRLLGDVTTMAGPNYSSAVRSCIKCETYDDGDSRGPGEDPCQQDGDVFLAVLRLLERDVESAMEGI